ncbi:hypothetical protein A4D02_21215 [Niastella koreensis]|uniref:Uncharacterized protein n=2 Tax=Niastella koreensis TaxID=354356 RepID=G8TJ92_NIAKG|nr:hypothetical protein [Niastella koreensis]AEV98625.1 hypothetical protein Niako_2276 [Niastella koreensis GR20-10]OQP52932.1 hypothetical protein A4D02_21215 [Niastella koreensis]
MRTLLVILMAFVGITSSLIGMLLLAYPVLTAYSYSLDFLQPTFSNNFLLPGTMFIITGIISLSALICLVQHGKMQYSLSLAGGISMMVWVTIHSIMIQSIPWLYSTYLICGFIILLLSWQLKGKWAA